MSFSGKETKIDWIQIDGKGDYFYHPKYPDIRVKRNENITEIEDTKNIKMGFIRLVCHKDKINPVIFKRCTFEQVNFNKEKGLELNCGVAFENCIFHKTTDFSNLIFHNNVSFKGTVFEGRAYFNNTVFDKRADFNKIVVRKTTAGGFYFKENNLVNLTTNSEIVFDNAIFEAPAFFTNRNFVGKVSFNEVVFKNTFDFLGVQFGTKAKLCNINIDYENITDVELCIKPLVNIAQNQGYLQMARDLQDLMKKLYKATPKLFKLDYNNITCEDKKTIISRKDTSLIIGVPTGTLKTWENRKSSILKFIKNSNETGYTLANIKEYLQQNPPKKKLYYDKLNSSADEIAVKSIFTVSTNASVSDILEKMVSNEYTHIPVLKDGIIQGVFSDSTFISYLIHHKMNKLRLSDIKISDLKDEIDLSQNNDSFVFIKGKTPLFKVRQMFVDALGEQKRLGAVFITDNGKKSGILQGLITSWDMAGL